MGSAPARSGHILLVVEPRRNSLGNCQRSSMLPTDNLHRDGSLLT